MGFTILFLNVFFSKEFNKIFFFSILIKLKFWLYLPSQIFGKLKMLHRFKFIDISKPLENMTSYNKIVFYINFILPDSDKFSVEEMSIRS